MLPEHFTPEGVPLTSASGAWVGLACSGSRVLAHLVKPLKKEAKCLDQGQDLHQCLNSRIFRPVESGALHESEVPVFDDDTEEAADAIFWLLKSIAAPGLFDGSLPKMGEERLTDGVMTAAPDLAWMEGDLLRVADSKRSGWDRLLPQASDSPQLLIQAGLLLRLWPPAKNASRVQVMYLTPEGEDMAPVVSSFAIVAAFSELEEIFLKPPTLDFRIGPHCARCAFAHVCPAVGKERIWPDLQTLSHTELAEIYRESDAREGAAKSTKDEAKREIMARLEGGGIPEEVGFKIRKDAMYTFTNPVGFLREHGIALESAIGNITLASARKMLAEKLDRGLTDQELVDLEASATKKFKAAWPQPISKKS